MDPRTAGTLAFRILGAYFAVQGLSSFSYLVTTFDAPGRYMLSLFLTSSILVGAGVLLWVLADQLASGFSRTVTTSSTDPDRAARVGIGLVGLVFLTLGSIELVQWLVQRGLDAGTFFPTINLPGFRGMIPPMVKAGAGLGLLLGAEAIARGAFGARPTAGAPQPIEGPSNEQGEP